MQLDTLLTLYILCLAPTSILLLQAYQGLIGMLYTCVHEGEHVDRYMYLHVYMINLVHVYGN